MSPSSVFLTNPVNIKAEMKVSIAVHVGWRGVASGLTWKESFYVDEGSFRIKLKRASKYVPSGG